MEPAIAGITAALLTLFDLDRTFYIPSHVPRKIRLNAWWWGFIVVNGLLAASLYRALSALEALQGLDPWLRAVSVGLGYLALIRAKLTTINLQGKDVPAGIEVLYEGAKAFVYKRINDIAKQARYDETVELARQLTLADLVTRAKLSIEQDVLLSPEAKREAKGWLLRVFQDPHASDFDKRAALADFILSGQKSGDFT